MRRLMLLTLALSFCGLAATSPFEGPYVGLRFGVGAQHARTTVSSGFPNQTLLPVAGFQIFENDRTKIGGAGIVAGGHGGLSRIFCKQLLVGAELAGSWAYLEGEQRLCNFRVYDNLICLEEKGSLIGAFRVGLIRCNTLIYATMGVALTRWVYETAIDSRPIRGLDGGLYRAPAKKMLTGFRPGMGLSISLGCRFALGVEVAYTYYGSMRTAITFDDPPGATTLGADARLGATVRPRTLEALLRLDYKLF